MQSREPLSDTPRVALVLAGGGARGAYEVGVVRYILEELTKELGRDVPIDILCGTSVGAINACFLAAHADEPRARGAALAERWEALRIEDILKIAPIELVAFMREIAGGRPKLFGQKSRGGLVDPAGLTKVLTDAIPFERIDEHVASGRLLAASVSTTHIGTGKTVVFVDHDERLTPGWGEQHPSMDRRPRKLRMEHALASAAIPFVFPAVAIEGELYCDGGLRQNVPLSPARRLGADRLIVINPHFVATTEPSPQLEVDRELAFPGPAFLLGKTLNALLLDRLDGDVDRLRRINEILAAGTREYGGGFVDALNRQLGLGPGGAGLRPLATVVVRASQDVGRLCADFVRSPNFSAKARGLAGRALNRMANSEGDEADLLSYLLFDGDFARELMALGEADARAKKDELCELFEGALG